ELETAAKWSKINSYIYLMWLVFGVLFMLVGLISLVKEPGMGIFILIVAGISTAVAWIIRKVFINYQEAANNAMQSLSEQAIEEVCHYQRNIFIVYGAMYVVVLVLLFIAGAVLAAMGLLS
ncbi:MAG: hypothetical protein IKG79_05630, partial [Neisseriaceae bacterium]|nr:hypothetical protein [Neisseriaceae bacterium]